MSQAQPELAAWQIGTTPDAQVRRAELNQPACFSSWSMDESQEAVDLQALFVKLGMTEPVGSERSPRTGRIVYMYRKCGHPSPSPRQGELCRACPRRQK